MTSQSVIHDANHGIYHPFMLHENELRILTNALMVLDHSEQKIIESMYGKVDPLYQKLLYPLQESYAKPATELKPKPVRKHGGDLDSI